MMNNYEDFHDKFERLWRIGALTEHLYIDSRQGERFTGSLVK